MKTIFSLCFLFVAVALCAQTDGKSARLIADSEAALGGWNKLYDLRDVSYTYDYRYPGNGQRDLSTERYIFEGEHSWGEYRQHDINVAPGVDGPVIQSLVDGQPAISIAGTKKTDAELLGGTTFLRKANYHWFTMFYKFDDPGTIATHQGTETIDGTDYEVVKLTYDAAVTGKAVNDEYVLYFNPETKLVERFFFSLPAMGVDAPVILMELDYETIDGIKIVTERRIYQPGADGKLPAEPQLLQSLSDVKFNNGYQPTDLKL